MSGKKFEKKIEGASEDKLVELYFGKLDYKPSEKEVEELRILSNVIPDPVKDNLQYAYYENRLSKLNKEKFRILTGYGQCRGNLVVHHSDIVVCCCREMATLVAYRNAHYYRGKIYVPGEYGNASNHNGSVFIISDEMGSSFKTCPFCEASITEKIDFVKFSEDEDAYDGESE